MARPFEFRLERVLELRRNAEDVARRELAAAREAVAAQNRVLQALRQEEADVKATLRGPGAVDAFRWAAGCLEALARRIAREEAVLQERTKAERANRRLLLEARKGVRVLERFREKQFGLHRRDAELEERKFLDEIGGTRAMGA